MNPTNSHAKYSPSASKRWLVCPGSVELSRLYPEQPEGAAAREGTEAHTCLELLLKNGVHKMLSTEAFLRNHHPTAMVLDASWAAQEIWKLKPKNATLLAETRSELFHIDPEMHGTSDAVIYEDFGLLHVIDFKYGRMPVDVHQNPQLIAYAIGVAHRFDYNFSHVICTVIQPRANHGQGPVRSWETTIPVILEWADKFKLGIQLAKSRTPPFQSGEHCFFCPAKPGCVVYRQEDMASMKSKFVTPKSQKEIEKEVRLLFKGIINE